MVIMYLRSRRATISVRACGAPSRSAPAAARGSLAPLAPATVPIVPTPRGWRRPTRTTTTRRLTSRFPLTLKNGKIDTRKQKENSRLNFSNQKKVSFIHFLKDFHNFLSVLLWMLLCACSNDSVGRMQTKTWGDIYKSYSRICRIMTEETCCMAIKYSLNFCFACSCGLKVFNLF